MLSIGGDLPPERGSDLDAVGEFRMGESHRGADGREFGGRDGGDDRALEQSIMMNENLFLNGVPIGVGEDTRLDSEKKLYGSVAGGLILGTLAGAVGGAMMGHKVSKVVGTGVGLVAGGIVGGAVGTVAGLGLAAALSPAASTSSTPSTVSAWRRIQIDDLINLKAGDQLAMSMAAPGGVPFSSEELNYATMQLAALATAPADLPIKNIVQYPPGAQLPADWPRDDDLGPNAFRVIGDVARDAPPEAAKMKPLPDDKGTIKIWERRK